MCCCFVCIKQANKQKTDSCGLRIQTRRWGEAGPGSYGMKQGEVVEGMCLGYEPRRASVWTLLFDCSGVMPSYG